MEDIKKIVKNHKCLVILVIIVVLLVLGIIGISIRYKIISIPEWLGFTGSFLGAIIGGMITFLGVHVTLKKSDEDRKNDKMDEIRPYLTLKVETIGFLNEKDRIWVENRKVAKDSNECENQQAIAIIKNVGLDSAVNIKCNGTYLATAIEKGEESKKAINYTYNKGEQDNNEIYLRFTFNDLRENQYEQEMIFELEKNERSEFNEKGVQKSPKLIQE